jgi:hypothetical protein
MKILMSKASAAFNAMVTTLRASGRATLGQRDAYSRRHDGHAERNDEHTDPEHGVVGRHVVGRRRVKVQCDLIRGVVGDERGWLGSDLGSTIGE